MATVRDVIIDAFRVGGVVPLGDVPTAEEANFALLGLQSMFHSWITGGMFGDMKDVFISADYTAKENERISVDDATVTIPDTFEDDHGKPRAPLQLAAVIIVTNSANHSYIYDRRRWVAIEDIALTDTCPLSQYGARGLACNLMIEMASLPTFGAVITPSVIQNANAFKAAAMRSRYFAHNVRGLEYY